MELEIKTRELNITAYQRNAVAIDVVDNTCRVILNTGIRVYITCPDSKDAGNIKDIILYYLTENENAGKTFNFEFTIKIIS